MHDFLTTIFDVVLYTVINSFFWQTASVHALAAQTNFAMKHIQGLQDQLRYLKLYLDKVSQLVKNHS